MTFDFDPFDPGTVSPITGPSNQCHGPADSEPSTAMDTAGCASLAWSNEDSMPAGLNVQSCEGAPANVRSCGGASVCFTGRWKPCAGAANGYMAVVWADAEDSSVPQSPMNIKLRIFDSTGNPASNEIPVNEPSIEPTLSSQESPAIAFDSAGRIVVVWTGPPLNGCYDPLSPLYVFARRFTWSFDAQPPQPVNNEEEFVVQSDEPFQTAVSNPTVAFSQREDEEGRFVVVWNHVYRGLAQPQVYARVFDWQAGVMGNQFRVNIGDETNTPRILGNSAQHTALWTHLGTIAATWTRNNQDVNVTLLPYGYAERLCRTTACCRGDLNGDGSVNGDDLRPWTKWLLNPPGQPIPGCNFAAAVPCELDMNGDCRFVPQGDDNDWAPFVCMLTHPYCDCPNLAPSTCCAAGGGSAQAQAPGPGSPAQVHPPAFGDDCNQNGVPDAQDISDGTSADCNLNGVPDECDVGFDPRITDLNHNLIPDECELSANANSFAQGTPGIDSSALVAAMDQWWNGFNYHGLKAWRIAYEIKIKFAELGFDLRTTVAEDGGQP